jgi:hypothetical protein
MHERLEINENKLGLKTVGIDYLGALGIDGRIILKWVLKNRM